MFGGHDECERIIEASEATIARHFKVVPAKLADISKEVHRAIAKSNNSKVLLKLWKRACKLARKSDKE